MLESLLGWNHLSFFSLGVKFGIFWGEKKNCSKFNDFYLLKKIAIF
jgi:hypothetical protein